MLQTELFNGVVINLDENIAMINKRSSFMGSLRVPNRLESKENKNYVLFNHFRYCTIDSYAIIQTLLFHQRLINVEKSKEGNININYNFLIKLYSELSAEQKLKFSKSLEISGIGISKTG